MCGRFTRKYTWRELWELYRLTSPASNLEPRYNVCPTTVIDAVVMRRAERVLEPMRWGLVPAWWSKPLRELTAATFNARAETAAEKPFFRDAFRRVRCLIPVSGYYEWQDTPHGKQPHYFTARDGSPVLTIAGLWDEWIDVESKTPLRSCSMIITDANGFVGKCTTACRYCCSPSISMRGFPERQGANCSSRHQTICSNAGRCRSA